MTLFAVFAESSVRSVEVLSLSLGQLSRASGDDVPPSLRIPPSRSAAVVGELVLAVVEFDLSV